MDGRKKLVIGIAVLVVVIIIAIVMLVSMDSSSADSSSADSSSADSSSADTAVVAPPNAPLVVPSKFMMNLYGTNLCADDGGSYDAGVSRFYGLKCDKNNLNHHFMYDSSNQYIKNANKPALCFDDIAATVGKPGNEAYLHNCQSGNINQKWNFSQDPDGRGFKIHNPNKSGLCLEGDPNGGKFKFNNCRDSVNQIFKLTSL